MNKQSISVCATVVPTNHRLVYAQPRAGFDTFIGGHAEQDLASGQGHLEGHAVVRGASAAPGPVRSND